MPLSPIPVVKILVVDDDSAIRSYLKACLSKKGHFIVEAKDGRESVELFNSEKPDLILMDVVMPVMNGYEAASIIKERCRGNFVPIIFLSALQDDESIAKCVSSGGDTFLSKPLSAALLDAKINSMIRIIAMTRELESYKQSTEEEIELTQYVFDSLTKRMSVNVVPGLNYWSRAAGHFSGDLMIYDKSPSGKLYVMLGDFTGHGFSAAIGAIPVSDVFFAMTRRDFSAKDILTEINRKLYEIMPVSHFCAAGFICFDPDSQQIEVFNGGLPPVLILNRSGKIWASVKSSSLALGILPSDVFTVDISRVDEADKNTVVLYSDGLTEAKDLAGEMFGEERLFQSLATGNNAFVSAKSAFQDFIGDRPLDDDVSLVTLSL